MTRIDFHVLFVNFNQGTIVEWRDLDDNISEIIGNLYYYIVIIYIINI